VAKLPESPHRTEEPVPFFRLKALHLASALGLPVHVVDERINVLIGALTADWLNEAATDVPSSTPLPIARHPLGHIVAVAGEHQVREALELGEYLTVLQDVPGISRAIAQLKSQYYQTVCQMAIAARIRAAGGLEMRLEPPAAEGRLSDIRFALREVTFQVECFRPTYPQVDEAANERVRLGHGILDAVDSQDVVVSVALALEDAVTPSLRRELASEAGLMARALEEEVGRDPLVYPTYLHQGEFGALSVSRGMPARAGSPPRWVCHPGFPEQTGNPELFLRTGLVPTAAITSVTGATADGVGTRHIAVWGPPQEAEGDPDKAIERIGRKIERKLVQARAGTAVQRLLVVDAAETRLVGDSGTDRARRLKGKIVDAHEGVAGLIMLWRHWRPHLGRYGYDVVPLLRSGGSADLFQVVQRIVEGEK
jgi:hypothetical protein